MAEVRSELTLENTDDRARFRRGECRDEDIRRTTVEGIVDASATNLIVIPQDLVQRRLGLRSQGIPRVSYADGPPGKWPIAGPVSVRIGEREMMMDCIEGAPGSEVIIGLVVLTGLDLEVDEGRLRPKHDVWTSAIR